MTTRALASLALIAACASSDSASPRPSTGSAPTTQGESEMPSNDRPSGAAAATLTVSAATSDSCALGQPCPVRVTVTNGGGAPARINKRLAVGYRDSAAREVFATWERADAPGTAPTLVTRDYQRDDATEYAMLAPGESVSTEFDLWRWYRPTEAGTYRIVFHYQADEKHRGTPPDVIAGVFDAAPITLRATK
jgi:hypothetical protein